MEKQAQQTQQGVRPKIARKWAVFLGSYAVLLGLAGWLIWLALRLTGGQSLEGIDGRVQGEVVGVKQDLLLRLEATLQRGGEMEISEEQINTYLSQKLLLTQQGMFSSVLEVKGVWVDLREGSMRLIFERAWGKNSNNPEPRAQTMAVEMDYVIHERERRFVLSDGSWNRTFVGKQAVPSGMMVLLLPALKSLYAAFHEEISLLEQMNSVRIEEGKLIVSAAKTV